LPARYAPAFQNVPAQTWADHARALYRETPDGLALRYDPALRDAVMAAFQPDAPPIDFWPGFEALDGLPLGLIRGQNSNILSPKTAADMRRRRPDMVFCNLADRGHVPFLNEAQAQALISNILEVL
jgi:hypothetical protein